MMTAGIALSFIAEYFAGRMLDKVLDHNSVAESLRAAYNKCANRFSDEREGCKYHFSQSQTAEQGVLKHFLMPESYAVQELINDLKETENLIRFQDEEVISFVGLMETECRMSSSLMPLMLYRLSAMVMKQINNSNCTNYLMTPEAFRTAYNKSIYQLATDLNNRFVGRDEEIRKFMAHMDEENAVIVISGRQGTGKTRFALEATSAYAAKAGYTVVCLSSFSSNINETLIRYLNECPKTIVLIDDVNQMTGSLDLVMSMIQYYDSLKIVCTVRDYALEGVRRHLRPYRYNLLSLGSLEESEQKEIITDISKRTLLKTEVKTIIKKSKSNLRMASMMVRKMNEGMSLNDVEEVSHLMDCYYSPVIDLVEERIGGNVLKVLASIAFYRVISRDDGNAHKIYDFTGVSENEFWHLAKQLHQLEVVDMFENEAVRFSDQQLMAYSFYKVFLDRKLLPFADLVPDNLHDDYKIARLRNTFDSVETIWNSRCIEQSRSLLKGTADSLEEDDKLLFYSVFWKVFPDETFVYFASMIGPDAKERTDFSDTPELCLHAFASENPAMILAMMARRWPDKKRLYYRLLLQLVRFGILYYPYLEDAFQNFEIHINNDGTSAFERRCAFLDFLHEELCARPSDLTVGRFVLEHWNHLLYVSEDCDHALISSKVWGLLKLFQKDKYPELRKSLAACHLDTDVDLELFDNIFDYSDFEHCYQIWSCIKYSREPLKHISAKFRSTLWPIFMKLRNKKGGLPMGNHLHLAEQIIQIREAIAHVDDNYHAYDEEYMLNVLLERSRKQYLEVLGVFLSHSPDCIRPYVMTRYFATYKSEDDLYAFMNVLESSLSGRVLCYHKIMTYACLDTALASSDRLASALNIFWTHDFSKMSLHYVFMLVDKYDHVVSRERLWNILLSDIHNKILAGENLEFSDGNFEKYAHMTDEEHFETLIRVLEYMEEHSCGESLSDEFYGFILERHPEFFMTMFRHRTSGPNEVCHCNFIWKLPNVKEIVKPVIMASEFRRTICKIEYSMKGTPEEYNVLRELLIEMAYDSHAVEVIFTIAANRFMSQIPDLVSCLVSHNSDIELFKCLRLTPDHYMYHGSFMHIQNAIINTLTNARDALLALDPLPVAHIAYLNDRISSSESGKHSILRREFAAG